jgi:hypothetical protein
VLSLAPSASASAATASAGTVSTRAAATVSAAATPSARFGVSSPAREALARALDPNDYQCGPTDFDTYINGLVKAMSPADLRLLSTTPALDVATYDALLHGSPSDPRYALTSGSAHDLTRTFRDLQRFWDIRSDDIQLLAMHGTVLQDRVRTARVLREVFAYSAADAATTADSIAKQVVSSPALAGGNNPIFTLNAFAFSAQGDPDPLVAGVPDKIVYGDGILDAMPALGLADVGPRVVLAHEFGHHVQFEDHLFDSPLTGAEATRRTELMADAMGSYFANSARGLALNDKRVVKAITSFYEVGDCAFTDAGHHGTPLQRTRAATWGTDLAAAARPQGQVLPSLTVARLFDAALPSLVAPDAR